MTLLEKVTNFVRREYGNDIQPDWAFPIASMAMRVAIQRNDKTGKGIALAISDIVSEILFLLECRYRLEVAVLKGSNGQHTVIWDTEEHKTIMEWL